MTEVKRAFRNSSTIFKFLISMLSVCFLCIVSSHACYLYVFNKQETSGSGSSLKQTTTIPLGMQGLFSWIFHLIKTIQQFQDIGLSFDLVQISYNTPSLVKNSTLLTKIVFFCPTIQRCTYVFGKSNWQIDFHMFMIVLLLYNHTNEISPILLYGLDNANT